MSVAAGIPDFRSPGTGLYDNLAKYELPKPTDVFDLEFFEGNPRPFFQLSRELFPVGRYLPTRTHHFLRLLCDKGLIGRIYTQNIDTLERVAGESSAWLSRARVMPASDARVCRGNCPGIPPAKLVEAHGSYSAAHCRKCSTEYSMEWMKSRVFAPDDGSVPMCECGTYESHETAVAVGHRPTAGARLLASGGVVKPDIVFFGVCAPVTRPRFCQRVTMADCFPAHVSAHAWLGMSAGSAAQPVP